MDLREYHAERIAEEAQRILLGDGKLTAEHVREAIFNNSSYASYDGARYYADGIGMQAVADELNTRAERTCKAELMPKNRELRMASWLECSECGAELSAYGTDKYCHECGARVIGGDE